MSVVDTRLFMDTMRKGGYTLQSLSDAIGMSRTGLFNKVHNKTDFRAKEISNISNALNLTNAEKDKIFFAVCVE